MEREGWGIINSPSCSKEMVDEGEVLLAFAGEGVYVEGFYAVAKFYKAEGVVKKERNKSLRDRVNPTLVPAIRIPGPREQTYTTETRSLVGIRREGSTRAEF